MPDQTGWMDQVRIVTMIIPPGGLSELEQPVRLAMVCAMHAKISIRIYCCSCKGLTETKIKMKQSEAVYARTARPAITNAAIPPMFWALTLTAAPVNVWKGADEVTLPVPCGTVLLLPARGIVVVDPDEPDEPVAAAGAGAAAVPGTSPTLMVEVIVPAAAVPEAATPAGLATGVAVVKTT